ncbi:MAG: HEAT repeat domain-containing protein [Planctomycetota bacterium]|nr:HEAT repeat domain-containing protein [Planctomycetota bacterium]
MPDEGSAQDGWSDESDAADEPTDELFRAGAPRPAPLSVERVSRTVMKSLDARRSRRRRIGQLAAALLVSSLVGVAVYLGTASLGTVSLGKVAPDAVEREARRESPTAEPRPDGQVVRKDREDRDDRQDRADRQGDEPDGVEAKIRALRELASRSLRRAAGAFWAESTARARRAVLGDAGVAELDEFVRAAARGLDPPTVRFLGEWTRSHDVFARRGTSARRAALLRDSLPWDWRDRLVLALGRSGEPNIWPLLEAALEVRQVDPTAMRAAGELGDPRAVPWLARRVLFADDRAELALEALGRVPGPESTEVLMRALASAAAVPAELWPGHRERIEVILRERRHESLEYLRRACRRDPGRPFALAVLTDLFADEANRELPRLLREAPPRVRPLVSRALARLGTPEAIEALLEALESPALRRTARQSLRLVAQRDFGPDPRSWQRWYREYAKRRDGRASTARDDLEGQAIALLNTPRLRRM